MIKILLLATAVLASLSALGSLLFSFISYANKESGWFLVFNIGFLLNMWWLCASMEGFLE